VFDLVAAYPIGYDVLMKRFDRGMINRFVERLNERNTGRSRLSEGHREMIEMAKRERESWEKQK